MAKEGKLSLKAYKHEFQASYLRIAKYYKAVEDKDALIVEYNEKFLKMKGNLIDKYEKLKKWIATTLSWVSG